MKNKHKYVSPLLFVNSNCLPTMENNNFRDSVLAILVCQFIGPNVFIIIGSIGSVIGVKIMEMYPHYCENHGIYIDKTSVGIAYGIYGIILGFIGIYVFLFVLLFILSIIFSIIYVISKRLSS